MKELLDYGIMMELSDNEQSLLDEVRQAERSILGFTYNDVSLHPVIERAVLQLRFAAQTLLERNLDNERHTNIRQSQSGFIVSNN